MMEESGVRRYVCAVSRRLICSKKTRIKLLEGLQQELSAYSVLSFDALCAEVGDPDQAAEQLMESIEESEIAACKRKRRIIISLVVSIFVVLLMLLTVYCIRVQRIVYGDFCLTRSNTENSEQVVSDGMLEE